MIQLKVFFLGDFCNAYTTKTTNWTCYKLLIYSLTCEGTTNTLESTNKSTRVRNKDTEKTQEQWKNRN